MATEILVIDDDTNICEMLRVYFENEGYEVRTANDGNEGISFFKLYEPDLVLLDIMLPKKDGWQVCREIREISSKPVIMITAKGDVFDKVLGLSLDKVTAPAPEKIDVPEDVAALAEARLAAKKEKNWAEADRLRAEIAEKGYIIKDTKEGYTIERK